MRLSANSRVLKPLASAALQSPHAAHERVGRSKVYIRPIQADLDITPVTTGLLEADTVSGTYSYLA